MRSASNVRRANRPQFDHVVEAAGLPASVFRGRCDRGLLASRSRRGLCRRCASPRLPDDSSGTGVCNADRPGDSRRDWKLRCGRRRRGAGVAFAFRCTRSSSTVFACASSIRGRSASAAKLRSMRRSGVVVIPTDRLRRSLRDRAVRRISSTRVAADDCWNIRCLREQSAAFGAADVRLRDPSRGFAAGCARALNESAQVRESLSHIRQKRRSGERPR